MTTKHIMVGHWEKRVQVKKEIREALDAGRLDHLSEEDLFGVRHSIKATTPEAWTTDEYLAMVLADIR